MPKITINGKEIEFEKGMTVLQACELSLIHISEPTRRRGISYAVFCLKKKKRKEKEEVRRGGGGGGGVFFFF